MFRSERKRHDSDDDEGDKFDVDNEVDETKEDKKALLLQGNVRRRDAAAVLLGLKFADNIHYKFKSSQALKAMLQRSKRTGANRI